MSDEQVTEPKAPVEKPAPKKPEAKASKKPATVTLVRGDETTEVVKPSVDYSRLVFGYGWKEA